MTEVTYKRYYRDIPKRKPSGKVVTELVGGVRTIVFEHRKGDIVLDSKGEPIVVVPNTFPIPEWFTNQDRERPHRRYNSADLHGRSVEGIKDAVHGLSTEDLHDVFNYIGARVTGRLAGSEHQVVRSVYLPRCVVYLGGELQYELFNDDGDLIEVLTEDEYNAKYADSELY